MGTTKLSEKRLAACRRAWAKRGALTPSGRERLRAAARRWRPWQFATGPKTDAGKRRCRLNSLKHGRRAARERAIASWLAIAFTWQRQLGRIGKALHTGDLVPRNKRNVLDLRAFEMAVACLKLSPAPELAGLDDLTAWLRKTAEIRRAARSDFPNARFRLHRRIKHFR